MTCKLWTIPMAINGGADERFRNANAYAASISSQYEHNKQIATKAVIAHPEEPCRSEHAIRFENHKNDWCSAYVFVMSPTKRHRRNNFFCPLFHCAHKNWHYILLHFLWLWRIIKSSYWPSSQSSYLHVFASIRQSAVTRVADLWTTGWMWNKIRDGECNKFELKIRLWSRFCFAFDIVFNWMAWLLLKILVTQIVCHFIHDALWYRFRITFFSTVNRAFRNRAD